MKTLILLGLLALSGSLPATALPAFNLSLTGRIIDGNTGAPLEYATVSAYGPDSLLVDGGITDVTGKFALSLPAGDYRLLVEFIGFAQLEQRISLAEATDLGDLALAGADIDLETVEVRAEKSSMVLKLDKKVFNVGQDALAQGGSANQVLAQLPSVTVSAEGGVSLRGNGSVKILINGRPSALADNNSLDAIPASSIESIEVISNPSARYEAAGTGGIINILLKKERKRGYGGSLTVGTGYPADHQALLNLNYRHEKFSAFGNLGARYANFRGSGELTRTSVLDGRTTKLRRVPDMDRNDRAWTFFGGVDYQLTANSTLTGSYSIYDVINDDLVRNDYFYTDEEGNRIRDLRQLQDYLEPGTYEQTDLIYAYDANKSKLTLQFNHDAWREVETEAIAIDETAPAAARVVSYRSETKERSRDYRLQADYERQLGEHGTFEGGLRLETRIISSEYSAERERGEKFVLIPGLENTFDYYERIASGYVQYAYQGERLGFQIGMRNEFTAIRVENADEAEIDFSKQYNRLFPSASFKYTLTEAISTQLSYSRRIRRPQFWQLNPFAGLRLPSYIFAGNPDIDPAYTDRLELNLVSQWDKLTLNPAVYGSTTSGYFQTVYDQAAGNLFGLDDGTIFSRPINLEREYSYGVEVTASYRPSDELTLSGDLHYRGYSQRGDAAERSFDYDFATWSTSVRAQYTFDEKTTAQLRVGYNGRNEDIQTVNYGTFNGEAGLSRKFGGKFTLSANVRAPRYFRSSTFRPSFVQDDYFVWTGWRYGITLAYKFEKGAGSEGRRARGSIR